MRDHLLKLTESATKSGMKRCSVLVGPRFSSAFLERTSARSVSRCWHPPRRAFSDDAAAGADGGDGDGKLEQKRRRQRRPTVTFHSTSLKGQRTAPSSVAVTDRQDATALVDGLLRNTRNLMGKNGGGGGGVAADGTRPVRPPSRHVLAFSGGVDSSLVAALLYRARLPEEDVRAVLGISPAVPAEQVELARRVADHVGIPLQQVKTTEGDDEIYIANAGQACLACKTHLYSTLSTMDAIVNHTAANNHSSERHEQWRNHKLYNGTNADDLKDPTRLGLIAAREYRVESPLMYITKDQVRLAARHLGLPNWNYAASPCLRSRLALGVQATQQHLNRIERAERFVKRALNLDETSNLRVRLLAKNRCAIEVDDDKLGEASQTNWDDYFTSQLGFEGVGVRAFKSGAVAGTAPRSTNSRRQNTGDYNAEEEGDEVTPKAAYL